MREKKRGRVGAFGVDHETRDQVDKVTLPKKRAPTKKKRSAVPGKDGWSNTASLNESKAKQKPAVRPARAEGRLEKMKMARAAASAARARASLAFDDSDTSSDDEEVELLKVVPFTG